MEEIHAIAMKDKKSSILRVLKGKAVVGAAFLVTERMVVTCAHVIETAGRKKGETINLKLNDGKIVDATVSEYWGNVNAEDVAILILDKPPIGRTPLQLGASLGTKGHKFSTYGFPKPGQEITGKGEIVGDAVLGEIKLIQLESHQVTPGFSGAPVFDGSSKSELVIGMVVSITPTDEYGRQGTTAFAIPSEMIHSICPDIPVIAGGEDFEMLAEELLSLPGMDTIEQPIIRKVYDDCYSSGMTKKDRLLQRVSELRDLLLDLAITSPVNDRYPHLLGFFTATLADRLRTLRPELVQMLHSWLKNHQVDLNIGSGNLKNLVLISEEQLNPPCLQIILEPYQMGLSDQQYILRCRDGRRGRSIFSDLTLKEDAIPGKVDEAIRKIYDSLDPNELESEIRFEDLLWIEVWLPTLELSNDWEQRKLTENSIKTLGQDYKVVVRSKYRWEKRFDLRNTWPKKWGVCKKFLANETTVLERDVISESLGTLNEAVKNAQVLGLPFEPRNDSKRGDLLNSLLTSGVPIAIWFRKGAQPKKAEQWLRKKIKVDGFNLLHLAEEVQAVRKLDDNLGKHIVLLWDNFDRTLADTVELKAP
ncbi:MAG: trypsin-like peptidase domain-containing protein [Chloroflexi bacterium]|nr:trypsin-like peptidase domain-containing protein [Chloroflexota bacterium]